MIIQTKISGIPCQAELTFWEYHPPSKKTPSRWEDPDQAGGWIVDYRILDRKGYPARWLEHKLTSFDHENISQKFIAHLKEDYYYEA